MSHKCQSVLCDSNGRPRAELASVSADFDDGQVIPEHSHPEDQLLFASEGVMTLSTKQGVWVVPPLRGLDSREHPALGGHVGAGFHENPVLPAKALSSVSREMFGHECIGAAKGANSLCLQD